jgi:hypothetical protein
MFIMFQFLGCLRPASVLTAWVSVPSGRIWRQNGLHSILIWHSGVWLCEVVLWNPTYYEWMGPAGSLSSPVWGAHIFFKLDFTKRCFIDARTKQGFSQFQNVFITNVELSAKPQVASGKSLVLGLKPEFCASSHLPHSATWGLWSASLWSPLCRNL